MQLLKNVKQEKIKQKLDRSASNGRRRCRSGATGDAREAPTEHFRKNIKVYKITMDCIFPSMAGSWLLACVYVLHAGCKRPAVSRSGHKFGFFSNVGA